MKFNTIIEILTEGFIAALLAILMIGMVFGAAFQEQDKLAVMAVAEVQE